ncbi:hypothetical protein AAE478_006288 [Parahypoxylon ruwenzoriense]
MLTAGPDTTEVEALWILLVIGPSSNRNPFDPHTRDDEHSILALTCLTEPKMPQFSGPQVFLNHLDGREIRATTFGRHTRTYFFPVSVKQQNRSAMGQQKNAATTATQKPMVGPARHETVS